MGDKWIEVGKGKEEGKWSGLPGARSLGPFLPAMESVCAIRRCLCVYMYIYIYIYLYMYVYISTHVLGL